MLVPGEVKKGDIVIYDGDEKVQVHLTDQRLLKKGQSYIFSHWHPTILTGVLLYGWENAFPARVFTKEEQKATVFVPGVLGVGQ